MLIKILDLPVLFCYLYRPMTTKHNKNQVIVGFIALGCPKNMVDSERMLAQIAQAGLLVTHDTAGADVIVINTCGFIAPAKAEAVAAIRRAIDKKRKGKVKKVIVAGCLPQREGVRLLKEIPGIDAIVGLEHRDVIASVITQSLTADKTVELLTPAFTRLYDDRTRLRITPRHWAYLRISEGCSRNCSFCTIPAIRGKFRSKPVNLVLAEAKELVESGAVELNIIAQDITSYGRDLGLKDALPALLAQLVKIVRLKWIRLLYLYPTGITNSLIETVAQSEKIVHYFDIPLQHINPEILKSMRRPHSKDNIRRLIETLRAKIPDCVLRTTFIVGFPGETDARFNEMLDFVKWASFDHLGCFTFYPEKGTLAARLQKQVPDRVEKQRLKQLMLTQQRIVFEKNKSRIGSRLTCLIDNIEKNHVAKARFFGQAPEIDSLCFIKNCSTTAGTFVKTKVIGCKDYDLICEKF
ncbi:MAG: 30S ribosomal protein S12 methylthiotransferase RimO [Sedimentisphaerales bacterium]|nr:30S ribosomal protein S12 methylthiotransferase RimO [Sedimentisphaerales bacterium]